MSVKFYENNAGGITAIVYEGNRIANIVGEIERLYSNAEDIMSDALSGFILLDQFDPKQWNGKSMEEVAEEEEELSKLIAEISSKSIAVYPDEMGCAGQALFEGLDPANAMANTDRGERVDKTAKQVLKEIGCITEVNHIHEFVFNREYFGNSEYYEEYFKIYADEGNVIGRITNASDGIVRSKLDYVYNLKFSRNVNSWSEVM